MYKLKSLIFIFIPLLFTGCFFGEKNLRVDLRVNENNKATISGKILKNTKSKKPYYLTLFKVEKETTKIVDFSIHPKEENFSFDVTSGSYFLYACQNPETLTKKRLGYQFYSDVVELNPQNNTHNIVLKLSENLQEVDDKNTLIETTETESLLKNVSYGNFATLDDVIFLRENGSKGLWEPKEFLREVGGGLYMLEEYTDKKIPLLFIHGMNGTPLDFETIISKIDRKKYQPWIYYYATGVNLNYSVHLLETIMDEMKEKYQLKKLVIIAHSMGGLVSREFINTYKSKIDIPTYITISTPWNGKRIIEFGEEYAANIIPSFGNMIPGSVFQTNALKEKLPDNLKHYLLFGYKGIRSFIMENSNDGTISLSSQLFESAQKQAFAIYGYNEDHVSILKEPKVINKINTILE